MKEVDPKSKELIFLLLQVHVLHLIRDLCTGKNRLITGTVYSDNFEIFGM